MRNILGLVLLLGIPACCLSADILMITLGGTKSHKIPFWTLAKGLIPRGHNITFVNGFPADNFMDGLEEINPINVQHYIRNYTSYDLLGSRLTSKQPLSYWDVLRYAPEICTAFWTDSDTQELIHRKFDLIIMDGAFGQCIAGLLNYFKVPFIHINTVGQYIDSIRLAGSPGPYSITPVFYGPFTDTMSFFDRIQNMIMHLVGDGFLVLANSMVHNVLKTHVNETIPHPEDLLKNVSFILQNGHATVSYLRPFIPNVAEIACIHCKPASPLPKHLEDFINGSGDAGFIYVSMGTSVKTRNMPDKIFRIFMETFSKLPYKVLWKYDGNPSDLPPNVKVERWLPQQDVLGHRKIKAFVTHAGLLSMHETIYHGCPVVTMPVFCDHDSNAAKAVMDGYAIKLELGELTADRLLKAITQIIVDPKYKKSVKNLQTLLKDQRSSPLDTAIYWTEYVIRHKGAEHLRSPARNLTWYQYYSYDIAACFVALIILIRTIYRRQKSYSIRIVSGEMKHKIH